MDIATLIRQERFQWQAPRTPDMLVPARWIADEALLIVMDDKVAEQLAHVAALPGIVEAAWALPDAHWGYGFPIGGVAAFDASRGGVISAGGVGFDIACGVRLVRTGLRHAEITPHLHTLGKALYAGIPAGVGSTGSVTLSDRGLDDMLHNGAHWAVAQGYGVPADLAAIEWGGRMEGADPGHVSPLAKKRQQHETGTLGSGNHYLEVQRITRIYDTFAAQHLGLEEDAIVVSLHCGSRGLGHQIATDYMREMVLAASQAGTPLTDRALAHAPIESPLGQRYLAAMRAGINCALANRQVLTHELRSIFRRFFPHNTLDLVYDVSHNTCHQETHTLQGISRELFVHRKGATRALPPHHPDLPASLRPIGQPVFVGGTMGTASYVMVGMHGNETRAFSSACHGAGRVKSRHQAAAHASGRALRDTLARQGILVFSGAMRGLAEEAPEAYKDVHHVARICEEAGLARRIAQLAPLVCIKG